MTRKYRTISGDSHPFVTWPDESGAWIEGVVQHAWEGDYGPVLELRVEGSARVTGVIGAGNDKQGVAINVGDTVNLGLGLAALERLAGVPIGAGIRVGFAGWDTNRAGQKFRKFKIQIEEGVELARVPKAERKAGPSHDADELPPSPPPEDGFHEDSLPF